MTAARPAHYFEELYTAAVRAGTAAGGFVDHYYALAGFSVRLRFAGPALLPAVCSALAHRETAPDPLPALSVYIWESATTSVALPSLPWRAADVAGRGDVRGYSDERLQTVFQTWDGALSMVDGARDQAVFWVPAAGTIPYPERAAPLRHILHGWLRTRGIQLAHAAAVGTTAGAVLLAGRGGSGKSTTSLACLDAGLTFLSDDYIALQADPAPYAHSLYSAAKLDKGSLRRLPRLRPQVTNPERLAEEKGLIFLQGRYPSKLAACLPVRAILIPRVTARAEPRLLPSTAGAALFALAPSTIFQFPTAGERTLARLAAFVRRVPCQVLELGGDVTRVPELVRELLAQG